MCYNLIVRSLNGRAVMAPIRVSTLFLFLLISCRTNLVYRDDVPDPVHYEEIHNLTQVEKAKVDIVWVVDNSYSMDPYQKNMRQNAEKFIKALSSEDLDWKMGMLTTSIREDPYLGFETPFHYQSQDIIFTFQDTIRKMGIKGDTMERAFLPLVKALKNYPWFLRNDAYLVVFYLSDEPEQSYRPFNGESIPSTDDFLKIIYTLKGNSNKVLMYGAFAFGDLTDCNGYNRAMSLYKNGRYEEAVTKTKGSHFSACVSNFGEEFVKVALDIRVNILRPHLIPEYRFVPKSFKAKMGDIEIQGGSFSSSGNSEPYWLYNKSTHVISFFNVNEIPDEKAEKTHISYQIDDGIER